MQVKKTTRHSGPLSGLRVVEFAGIGPGPFACMLLSDMGADVVRIDRPGVSIRDRFDIIGRGRSTVLLDLKNSDDQKQVMELLRYADVLVEGFRPGVMERLGLGPNEVSQLNPGLVYGRMTGWGQSGPLSQAAGHDINYISIAGALSAIGAADGPPIPPLNLVGDYGGGSLYLVTGILAAVIEATRSGLGQVVDAAISDGVASLMSLFQVQGLRGTFQDKRGSNMLDGGAPYYTVYETSDKRFISLGPIEPKFFELLCEKIGIPNSLRDAQHDASRWVKLRDSIASIVRTQTREYWCQQLEGTDVCFAPVLNLGEAPTHPHNLARSTFVEVDGVMQSAPAPRFSRTPSQIQGNAPDASVSVESVLKNWS